VITAQTAPPPLNGDQTKAFHHFGGGLLSISTLQEQEAFARGRIEAAADLVELCASALGPEQCRFQGVLMLAHSMLHEANNAFPSGQNR
jgi:hypothetical protein